MKQRDFLKLIGVATVAPAALVKAKPDVVRTSGVQFRKYTSMPVDLHATFDPTKQCGAMCPYLEGDEEAHQWVVWYLKWERERIVPPEYRDKVVTVVDKLKRLDNSRYIILGWKYNPQGVSK